MTAGRFPELPTAYLFLPIGGLWRRAFLGELAGPFPHVLKLRPRLAPSSPPFPPLTPSVISSLGIFKSRVHLVSMAEAVRGDATEETKFKNQIPGIAQAFLPRWREKLYRPLAVCLE